ncbi:MAG: mechanosensitive ion channel [Planctomycetes bacterium]|nr:mechanosensitive ion channel [Planctomycetota bacterium]
MSSHQRQSILSGRGPRSGTCLSLALALSGWLVFSTSAAVAQAPAVSPVPLVSVEQVRAALDELQAATDTPDVRQKATDLYQQALGELSVAATWNGKGETFRNARNNAPRDLEAAKAQLERTATDATAVAPDNATLEQLKATQAKTETARVEAQQALAELDVQNRYRGDRIDEIRVLDAAAKTRLEELDKQLEATPETAEVRDPVRRASRTLLLARRTKILAERASYSEELPSYEATRELLRLKLDLATRRLHQAQQLDTRWREIVAERSRADAALKARDARWAVLTARPEVMPLARENEKLAELRNAADGPAAKVKAIEKDLALLNGVRTKVQAQFAHVRKITELTDAVGQLLQRQRDDLPDLQQHRAQLQARQGEIAEIKLKLLDLETRRNDLADIDAQVQQVIGGFAPAPTDEQVADIQAAVHQLLVTRRDYLDALIADYNQYFQMLVLELDRSERDLVRETEEYAEFIDERILWIRSTSPLAYDDLRRTADALEWTCSPQHWQQVLVALTDDCVRHPVLNGLFAALVLGLFLTQPFLRRLLRRINDDVVSNYSATILPTLRVVALTARLAMPLPATMLYVSWRIAHVWDATPFCKSVAFALKVTAVALATTDFFRQVCRHQGLAQVHFGWPEPVIRLWRRNFRWLIAIGIPHVFIVAMIHVQESDSHNASLGRLTFIAGLLMLALFAWRVTIGIQKLRAASATGNHVEQSGLRAMARMFAIGVPLALAAIAALGFYYTALTLTVRLQVTLWLAQGLILAHAVALRWLLVARRRLAIRQARERRSVAGALAGACADQTVPGPSCRELDLSLIDVQTRRLLRGVGIAGFVIALWVTWVGVLPALAYLDQWPLWSYTEMAMPAAREGSPTPAPIATERWITVRDLLLAAVVSTFTLVSARNLPGLLEIAWLQRLPLDAGGRYTLTAVTRYVILLVGTVSAFHSVGVGWANVQWLVAAITVGLGFGLQEIFANFVSGLIVLIERPIRVGDTVTVGNVSGTVSRIRARATTITDWDRKELIVPNKEFITGQVVNWTLSDSVLRQVVKVGVAYDSDVPLVVKLLHDVAGRHPAVLKSPEPVALLAEFGDSALQFELRVFVAGLDQFTSVRHQLHMEIEREFRAHGIGIPFPQCDVHIHDTAPAAVAKIPRLAEKRSA